ncbi:MAG: hypothetical protein J6X44_03095 [Thermoguttaceae bacterium]|nr:hypothetical protein [Thermoguttaceae bacterium]
MTFRDELFIIERWTRSTFYKTNSAQNNNCEEDFMNNKQRNAALENMIEWLADPHELG